MTLQELADAWNLLRNGALGRGTRPLVSPELADEVARSYAEFRRWLQQQGPLSELVPEVTATPWIALQRELAAKVRAQGQYAPDIVRSPIERATESVTETVTETAKAARLPVLVLGLGALGLTWAVLRGRM